MADSATTDEVKEVKTPETDKPAITEKGSDDGSNVKQNKEASTEGSGDEKTDLEKAQKEIEDLKGDVKIANDLQSQADRKTSKLERTNKRLVKDAGKPAPKEGEGEGEGGEETPTPQGDDAAERSTAEVKISRVLLNPKYRPLLDSDPTLLDALQRNPLLYVDDFIDAEDAVDQMTEYLDDRLSKVKPPEEKKPEEKKEEENKTPSFNAGSPNPQGGATGSPKTAEEHRKAGNTDAAVETSILDKMGKPRQ